MGVTVMASQQQYTHVPSSEEGLPYGFEKQPSRSSRISVSSFTKIAALVGGAFVSLVAVFALGYASGYKYNGSGISPGGSDALSASNGNCTEPLVRQEWRSLSKKQKKSYLDAFQCFIDSPSQLGMNGSLYNDFSWAHNLVAHSSTSECFACIANVECTNTDNSPFRSWKSSLPDMAPALHLSIREATSRNVRLRWCFTVRIPSTFDILLSPNNSLASGIGVSTGKHLKTPSSSTASSALAATAIPRQKSSTTRAA